MILKVSVCPAVPMSRREQLWQQQQHQQEDLRALVPGHPCPLCSITPLNQQWELGRSQGTWIHPQLANPTPATATVTPWTPGNNNDKECVGVSTFEGFDLHYISVPYQLWADKLKQNDFKYYMWIHLDISLWMLISSVYIYIKMWLNLIALLNVIFFLRCVANLKMKIPIFILCIIMLWCQIPFNI